MRPVPTIDCMDLHRVPGQDIILIPEIFAEAMSTVYGEFRKTCEKAGQKAFLHIPAIATQHYADGDIDYSYAEAWQAVKICAASYADKQYGSPMRVALLLENRAEFFIHWLSHK